MAWETGDLIAQASGNASLGAEMTNGGFTGEIRPYAHVHMNSGIFHDPMHGYSGIIRYDNSLLYNLLEVGIAKNHGLEISIDGGLSYAIGVYNDALNSNLNLIHAINGKRTGILSSGLFLQTVGNTLDLSAYGGAINIISSLKNGAISINAGENFVGVTAGAAVGTAFQNKGIRLQTSYTNIALEAGVVGANMGDILLSAWAGSGQLRYQFGPHQAWHWKPSYASTGGPANDGFFPMPHSGQIVQMILASAGSSATQQSAYDAGNEILTPLKGTATQGVVVKMPVKATGSYDDSLNPYVGHTTYGFAVSGSIGGNTSLARLTSSYLHIRNSGLPASDQDAVFIGFHDPLVTPGFNINASGEMNITAEGGFTQTAQSFSQTTTNGTHQVQVTAGTLAFTTNNPTFNIEFTSAGDIVFQADDTITLSVLGSNSQTTYRQAAHEAWHWKPSYASAGGPANDGYFPIPHSGQIATMIAAAQGGGTTLQGAYNTGAGIYLTNGDLILHAITGRTRFGTTSTAGGSTDRAPMNISGIFSHLDTGTAETGDIAVYSHNQVHLDVSKTTNPTSDADARAKSLGLFTEMFNTGSGQINISIGSGIAQFFNINAQTLGTTATGVNFPAPGNNVRDYHYHATGSSGIVIMTPGLYKASYQGVMTKTAGTTPQGIRTYLVRNNIEVLGSRSAGNIPDATANECACNASALFDALAGDTIALAAELTNSPGSNTVTTRGRGVTLILEYIGPRRATQTTLLGA